MGIALRSYIDSDRQAIAALLRAHSWPEHYISGQLDAVAELIASGKGTALTATARGSFAGYLTLEIHSWNSLAQIQGLAVRPEWLRQGVASRLVEAAEGFARERSCRGIYVDTPVDNERGRAFYAAHEFAEHYRMTRYYSDDLDGVTYVKFFS